MSIGIIIKDLSYPFYQFIATGTKEYADTRGYCVIVASSEDNHRSEEQLTHLFSEKDVKGTIIAPTLEGESEIEHLFKLKRLNYPAVITALTELSIRVPDDISVIGNDDISYANMCLVPLTTVRAPQHEIGVKAAAILIRHIESPSLLPPERVILETEFVLRGSSKAMNS
jgi:DNA-binding LacI/PurR family transcriptional regulator